MSTLRERGRDAGVRRLKQAAGATVTYARLNGNTLTPTAVSGITTATSQELPGRIEISARDYLIAVADLVDANGTAALPQIGDRITETINGVAKTFEVQEPQTGEPAWRYTDADRVMWRIHTKAV